VSTPISAQLERRLLLAIDVGERIFILILFARLVARISLSLTLQPYNAMVLLSEGLVAYFVIVRRPARNISLRPLDWAVALACTALAMFVEAGGQPLLPSIVGIIFMFFGLCLAIWAKLSLRRSFGIAAANRGAIVIGPYRFVRHPMYTGYIIIYVGFLLNNPLLWNFCVYGLTTLLLVVRLRAEENILMSDPVYLSYSDGVRFRLFPALF
jgi:protein-S-isoprenylcysteine O-methyltransferase Ste14